MQQVGVLLKFFSHTIPDVLEESGLTQVCSKTPVHAARGVGNHVSLRIVIMETCWNELHNWNTAVEDYKLYRRDRLGRSRSVALSDKEWVDCERLSLRQTATNSLSLWVKVKDHTNKGHLVSGIY